MTNLKLTAEMIKNHLFNGGFRPFDEYDWMAYADAELGSLITNMEIGKYYYEVIFTPSQGNVQIFYVDPDGNSECWEMDLNTGEYIEL